MLAFAAPLPLPLPSAPAPAPAPQLAPSRPPVPAPPTLLSTPHPPPPSRPHPLPKSLHAAIRARSTASIPSLVSLCLQNPPLPPTLWRRAIRVCLHARAYPSAERVLSLGISALPRRHLPLPSLVPPLLALARARRFAALHSLLAALHARGPPAAPDERLLVSLANAATDARAYPDAARLLALVPRYGLALSPVGYSVLLKTHGRARHAPAVRAAVADLRSGAVPLDTVLLNSAVDALVRCDALPDARHLLSEDRFAPLVNVASYNTIIKGLVRAGRLRDAFQLADRMRQTGCAPNHVTRNTLVAACVAEGDFDRAWALADGSRTLQGLANDPAEDADDDAKGATREGLFDPNQSPRHPARDGDDSDTQLTIALTSLAAGLAENGRVPDALALLRHMKRRNAPPSDITYAALVGACFRRGATLDAARVFDETPPRMRSVLVCNAFVAGLAARPEPEALARAAELVRRMAEGACAAAAEQKPPAVTPTAESYNPVLEGFVKARSLRKAEDLLRDMDALGCAPDTASYTILMKGYAEERRFAKAKGMFREISRRGLVPDRVAFNVLLTVCVRSSDTASAVRVLEFMEGRGGVLSPGVYSYAPVISGFLRAGEVEDALAVYERMKERKIPLNAYLAELVITRVIGLASASLKGKRRHVDMEKLAITAANLLRDSHADGVDIKALQKCRRMILKVFVEAKYKRHFRGLDFPEIQSASEKIFEKHGWNDIDSGWRIL